MRRVETVRKSLWWQVESIYPSAGSFSLLLFVGMIFRDKEGIQAAVFKTNNRTMMWQGDLILGLERASLQSHLLVLLWIISARFKTLMEIPFPHKHFCFTQIWLSRSRLFLPHSVFVSPPLLSYWRMLSQSSPPVVLGRFVDGGASHRHSDTKWLPLL